MSHTHRAGLGGCPIELSACEYVGHPDVLLEDGEALPCDPDASQNFGLTSSIVRDQPLEVDKLVHQVDVLCCYLDRRLRQTWFPDALIFVFDPVHLKA